MRKFISTRYGRGCCAAIRIKYKLESLPFVDGVLLFFVFFVQVTIQGEWAQWNNKVPKIEVETHKVGSPDIVVPTLDTVRHESLLYTWLAEHKPMVLCGPPGSGKTMTLFSALRALPDFEVHTCMVCTCIYVP